jgi:hypothetical protein
MNNEPQLQISQETLESSEMCVKFCYGNYTINAYLILWKLAVMPSTLI